MSLSRGPGPASGVPPASTRLRLLTATGSGRPRHWHWHPGVPVTACGPACASDQPASECRRGCHWQPESPAQPGHVGLSPSTVPPGPRRRRPRAGGRRCSEAPTVTAVKPQPRTGPAGESLRLRTAARPLRGLRRGAGTAAAGGPISKHTFNYS